MLCLYLAGDRHQPLNAVCGEQVEQDALGRLRPLFYAWLSTAFLAAGEHVLPRCELDKVASPVCCHRRYPFNFLLRIRLELPQWSALVFKLTCWQVLAETALYLAVPARCRFLFMCAGTTVWVPSATLQLSETARPTPFQCSTSPTVIEALTVVSACMRQSHTRIP